VVTFDASDSLDPDGFIVRYDWDFGDGALGTGPLVVHPYVVEGARAFTATLSVTDDAGNQDATSVKIEVLPPPEPEAATNVGFTWPFHFDAEGDDAANLNDEYFAIENAGDAPIDLGGWSVTNERGLTYVFPAGFVLPSGGIVLVHSGAGEDRQEALYWDAGAPVWNDDSDIATLQDPGGMIVDIYAYHSC
jgi:hypothetical protein